LSLLGNKNEVKQKERERRKGGREKGSRKKRWNEEGPREGGR
jgi:hypothetical protein